MKYVAIYDCTHDRIGHVVAPRDEPLSMNFEEAREHFAYLLAHGSHVDSETKEHFNLG